jgi:hypothetical protein
VEYASHQRWIPLKLPALHRLGDLADTSPVILINPREQTPLSFLHLAWRPGTLHTGDYSVAGLEELFAVERNLQAEFDRIEAS